MDTNKLVLKEGVLQIVGCAIVVLILNFKRLKLGWERIVL